MKTFHVLDRHLDLHRHYLLEASAGTGKTFSIQNIVARLIMEPAPGQRDPLTLNQILVVTFTRAATRDLKQRIHANLDQLVQWITNWMRNPVIDPSMPDYLIACLEKGEDYAQIIRKRLQQALFAFDQAQIFTIHSFCSRMLRHYAIETDMGLQTAQEDEPLPAAEILAVIRDFFRTEIRPHLYSPSQLEIILKEDPDQRKLLKIIQSSYDFPDMPTFEDLYQQFQGAMRKLKEELNLSFEEMIEDFKNQLSDYRSYKSGETKLETLNKVTKFAKLFDQTTWSAADFDELISDGVIWTQALDPKLLKSRANGSVKLFYPMLMELLKQQLEPLVQKASDYCILLARLARDCQQMLKRYQREEERLAPDDLLRKMEWSLHHPTFVGHIQSHYQAAIIDEFQDTDPIQWQIFKRLFIPDDQAWKGYLYLVGDPKQSIYSFRQADIYTYLAAVQALGEHSRFSLDTNYRSQSSLVEAINTLLSTETIPQFIPLPKQALHLPYQPVKAAKTNKQRQFHDGLGSLHFVMADGANLKRPKLAELESQVFFPFILQELDRLKQQEGWSFRQFAVLVRDRHQATRLAEFFDQHQIPYLNQRGTSLAESPALAALIEVLNAVLHPYHLGAIKAALGCALIGWTHEEIKAHQKLENILLIVQQLRQGLIEKGFSYFFQNLLQSRWHPNGLTILEGLLNREGGIEFYHDLQQIADIVIQHQYREWSGPEGIIPFLDRLQIWHSNDDDRVKRFQDPSRDGVKILTLHFSKGLEFEIVFALGLANRNGMREELIPIETDGKVLLTPLSEEEEKHQLYFEENDAEKMRQLYVAMTRAKYRLYVPIALNFPSENIKVGEASPMELFLGRFKYACASYEELYERIRKPDMRAFVEWIETVGRQHHISYSIHHKINCENREESPSPVQDILFPPKSVEVPGESCYMTSFSRLVNPLPKQSEHYVSSSPFPHNFECLDKTVHTLPASHETGILLHHILEKLSFQDFKNFQHIQEVVPLIRPFIRKTAFKEWETVLAAMLFHTLKTTLTTPDCTFCLADIVGQNMYREMPFLFPHTDEKPIEGLRMHQGFVQGVIDLSFIHQGKYYIVDWKSNWLGPSYEAYHPAHLEHAMADHSYGLQASLYVEALQRYLKVVDNRPFEECFGGVFYLFLRGMQIGSQNGLYYFRPGMPSELIVHL